MPRGKKETIRVESEKYPIVEVNVSLKEKAAETNKGWIEWFREKIVSKLTAPVATFYFLFTGLSGPALANDFWKGVATIGGVIVLSKIAESLKKEELRKKAEKLERASYEGTLELNDFSEVREFLKKGKTFAINDQDLKIDYYSYKMDLKMMTKHHIRKLLSELGLKEVGNIREIEEITRERQKLRKNPEVIQERVPQAGTLEPYQFKVSASVSIATNRADISRKLNLYFANLKGPRSTAISVYESLRETDVLAIVEINIMNIQNNEVITIIGLGTPYILETGTDGTMRAYYQSRSEYYSGSFSQSGYQRNEVSIFNSVWSAFENLRKGLSGERRSEQERLRGELQNEQRKEAFAWLVISTPQK